METDRSPILKACATMGGQAEMARVLGVTPSAVHQWCKGVREVPAERCVLIERETRAKGAAVHCEELRPDVAWGVLRGQSTEQVATPEPTPEAEQA